MIKEKVRNTLIVVFALVFMVTLLPASASAEGKTLRIVLEDWTSEIASGNLVKAVLKKKLGVNCILKRMSVTDQYTAISNGTADALLGAWLPSQDPYYQLHKGDFVDLGPNLEGARLGLVVPQVSSTWLVAEDGQKTEPYMLIDSTEEIKDHYDDFDGKIVGIEVDSGMMKTMRERLLPAYGLEDFELVYGDEVSMTSALANAIKRKQWIVVVGWTPHWKFGRWNLKFLDDPKNIWGASARINTLVRKGLKEDMPNVYKVLDKFSWTPSDMEQLLVWNEMKDAPYDNALRWMNYNRKSVDSWTK